MTFVFETFERIADEYAKLTEEAASYRALQLDDAEIAIICMNSAAGSTKYVVDELRKRESSWASQGEDV
jgi:pyruvate/2-oxoacid:ferredoxin oxidoreductase alpha subunit